MLKKIGPLALLLLLGACSRDYCKIHRNNPFCRDHKHVRIHHYPWRKHHDHLQYYNEGD